MSVLIHHPESHIEGVKFLAISKLKIPRNFESLDGNSVDFIKDTAFEHPQQ